MIVVSAELLAIAAAVASCPKSDKAESVGIFREYLRHDQFQNDMLRKL